MYITLAGKRTLKKHTPEHTGVSHSQAELFRLQIAVLGLFKLLILH